MRAYKLSAFAASPLITPQQLETDRNVILKALPKWAGVASLVAPDLDSADDMVALSIRSTHVRGASTKISRRDENGGVWFLTVPAYAFSVELTRFGNSLAVNTNGPAEDAHALFYLKMTFAGARQDNLPVARLIVGAGVHEHVTQRKKGEDSPKWLTRNLHTNHLAREGAGKPEKDARSAAIEHAKRRAEKVGQDEAHVRAYVDNLHALFAYHDELYGLA